MKKKKTIYITDHFFSKSNFYKYKATKKKFNIIFNEFKKPLNDDQLITVFKKHSNIVGIIAGLENYSFKTLFNQKKLKAVSRVGVGIDSLDKEYLKLRKIKIIKLKNELTDSVAELFLTLILTSLRKIIENYSVLKKKKWNPIIGNNLANKKVGIIGYGKIGRKLHKYLKVFNCKVFIFEKKKIKNHKKSSLEKIFKICDVVCVSLSLNSKTKNFINNKILKNARKDIIIINASRGAIINEIDLLQFLKINKKSSTYLDCFTNEPYEGKLLDQNNVFAIPHIASLTKETRYKMEHAASKNLINYLKKF
jgi:D-3-phosphoglycerate dehydrogenase / 2-oxoglutarate reductase